MDFKVGDVVKCVFSGHENRRQVVVEIVDHTLKVREAGSSNNQAPPSGYSFQIHKMFFTKASKLEQYLYGGLDE